MSLVQGVPTICVLGLKITSANKLQIKADFFLFFCQTKLQRKILSCEIKDARTRPMFKEVVIKEQVWPIDQSSIGKVRSCNCQKPINLP